ncbi:NAD(P)/FAD-dependent oxidoreductase [Nonomuraea dietziae]|uniref:NAD(P)/FAD-dependent oxidoreductase n=1 Tax=Nonomuraea dietziae TaxID=65515 RepID=UPI00340E35A9
MTEHNTSHKVVVIGGGYAGTLAANRLRMRDDVDITLVNPRPEFVERIRLHQFVARTGDATIDYGTLLGEGIQLVVDSATRIDTAARTVRLASGRALDYDYVIYAVGSTGAVPSVPGAAEFTWSIAELESAQRLRARLEELPLEAQVTVVGGGLTGVETAAELAEQGRKVTLVCGRTLAPYLSAGGRRYVAKWLTRHGVAVLEGDAVTEVRPDSVVLADGSADSVVRPSALTIWDGRFRPAGAGGGERAAHRRARPAAHRRDADQHRRRPHRRGRRRRRAVGPAAADEWLRRRATRGTGRRHRAEPHRGDRTGDDQPGLHGRVRQPRPARRHQTDRR